MSKITMDVFAASEAKNHFGRLIDAAQRRPITIEKRGRPVAYVVSPADMEAMEDYYLGVRATEIMRTSKSLGVKESEALLRRSDLRTSQKFRQ
jgi:prevent-host-death family protein